MKKEYVAVAILGLFILAYVLDAVVNPLTIPLATPYHYFTQATLSLYAFTTVSIILKSFALFGLTLLMLFLLEISDFLKASIVLVISGLLQLYALQDVATNSRIVPLEWSLAFTLTGLLLFIPLVFFAITGTVKKIHGSLKNDSYIVKNNGQEK